MKRGEGWTLQDDNYASKPRPVVVVQADLDVFESVIVCLLTSFDRHGVMTRVVVEPSSENGLRMNSYVMTDKLLTVRRGQLRVRAGELGEEVMHLVSRSLVLMLGIANEDVL